MPDFGMTSLGDTLRAERMRRGKDLSTLAAETKIRRDILEAIERNQFDSIPGGAYRPSFLRQYAHALGLDEAEAIAAFHQQYGEEPDLPLPAPPKNTRPRRILELGWVLAIAAALLGIYKIAESLHAGASWRVMGIMGQAAQSSTSSKPSTPSNSTPSKPPAPAPAPLPASDSSGSADRSSAPAVPMHVTFTATEPVWMSVKCDGNPSYTGTLIGPETKTFEASNSVTVLVGNAGGVAISLNGKSIGPVGQHGETKSLEITPSGAHPIPRQASAKTAGGDQRLN
jgi:cytoskeleton protein RodZ